MKFKIDTTKDCAKGHGIAVCLYSDPGVGKTTLLGTLPEGKTLFIDADGGVDTLTEKNHSSTKLPLPNTPDDKSYAFLDTMNDIYNHLRFEKHNYEHVVIDSASELEKYFQLMLSHVRGKQFVSLKEYGDASQLTAKYLKQFRDLKFPENNTVGRPINVFFSALQFPLEITRTEDRVITKMYPMLTKKLAPQLCGLVDIVARLEVTPDNKRMIRVIPLEDVEAKSRREAIKYNIYEDNGRLDLVRQFLNPIFNPQPITQTTKKGEPQKPTAGTKPQTGPVK